MNLYSTDNYTREYIRERKKKYSLERILDHVRKGQILRSLEEYRPTHILEIGSGPDPFFNYYKDFDRYVIVEPNKTFFNMAKKYANKSNKNVIMIKKRVEDAERELLNLCPFDIIIASSLLHEVLNPDEILKVLNRLSDEKTITIVNVPNAYSFHRLLALEAGLIKDILEPSQTDRKFNRYWRFDKATIFRLLEENGFTVLRWWTSFVKVFDNRTLEKLLKLRILNEEIIKGLERMSRYMPDMGCELFVEVKKTSSHSTQHK